MHRSPNHTPVRQRNQVYLTRLLASTAVSVLVMLVVFRLPLGPVGEGRVGWQIISPDEVIALEEVRFEEGLSQLPGIVYSTAPPVETDQLRPETRLAGSDNTPAADDPGQEVGAPAPNRVQRLERLVLAAAETMPQVRGGMGAYYINITYPEEAINAGVQGRVVLDFVVETDGRATGIEVYSSLHPMCDSAAVQALRKTLFMPGQSGGKAVAVKMRLPVLFQIVSPQVEGDSLSTAL